MTVPDPDRDRGTQAALRYAGAGLEFFAAIALLALAGVWLDGRLGSTPGFTIAGAFLGFAAGTWNLVHSVTPQGPSMTAARRARRAARTADDARATGPEDQR
jgi:F0F1-type ATP synthase assembly protein I